MPQPRAEDPLDGPLHDTRPLLAVVPAPAPQQGQQGQQHLVQLYSLRSQGYARTLGFGSEVLAVLASPRVLVVAVRGQLHGYDAVSLERTFSCCTHYLPPPPPLAAQQGQQQGSQQPQGQGREGGGALAGAPCALGPRWLAYAADQVGRGCRGEASWEGWQHVQGRRLFLLATGPLNLHIPPSGPRLSSLGWPRPAPPQAVQPSGSQARAQRLPLHRRDSTGSAASSGSGASGPSRSGSLEPGISSPGLAGSGGSGGALTRAAMAEAAREYAVKGGQQLAGLAAAAGSASYKYLHRQYSSWRSGAQQGALAPQASRREFGTLLRIGTSSRPLLRPALCAWAAAGALGQQPPLEPASGCAPR